MLAKILIVDDEIEVRTLIAEVLEDEGYAVMQAENELIAMHLIKNHKFDLIFLDLWMDNNDVAGLDILKKIKKINPNLYVIMVSGHGSIDTAITAIKCGAYDFIEKPFTIDRLLLTTNRALESSELKRENLRFKQKFDFDDQILGISQHSQNILRFIEKMAIVNSRIILSAEIGCNADTVAYLIHNQSNRSNEKFIIFNCNDSDYKSVENGLFGNQIYAGALEKANNGTIYLENITNLHIELQKKLSSFLQKNQLPHSEQILNVRVICHSQYLLNDIYEEGLLIDDLYYKLNICSLQISPLRARKEDLKIAVDYYLSKSQELFGIATRSIDNEAIEALKVYNWPGNFRQLRNAIENMLITASMEKKDVIDADCIPFDILNSEKAQDNSFDLHKILNLSLKDARTEFEKEYIKLQLNKFSGNISSTAEFLGIDRSSLHRKMRSINLEFNIYDSVIGGRAGGPEICGVENCKIDEITSCKIDICDDDEFVSGKINKIVSCKVLMIESDDEVAEEKNVENFDEIGKEIRVEN